MLNTGHPIEHEELMAYLDGELEVTRASVAAEHLERCADCRKLAADLRGVSRAMLAWEVEESGLRPPAGRSANLRRWWRSKPVLAVAASCMVAGVWVTLRNENLPSPAQLASSAGRTAMLVAPERPPSTTEFGTRLRAQFTDRQIVRTAELELAASDLEDAHQAMEATVNRHRGYIGTINMKMDSGAPRWINANLVIPSHELAATLAELRKVGRVVSESQLAEDVTERSVDLDARLSNARIAEQRLKEILQQRPGKISEVLEVEREVARVRGEIEKMDAERKGLATRVDFATISVKVGEPAAAQSHGLGAAASRGWKVLVDGLTAVAETILTAAPTVLLLGALFFPARFAWKRFRKKSAA